MWGRNKYLCKTCKAIYTDKHHQEMCRACDIEWHRWNNPRINWNLTMTPDDLYNLGYEDGKAGKAMAAAYMTDPNYTMGYEDGKGDAKIEKPVEKEYTEFNDAPEGFRFFGVKRVPQPYEFYLSKNGSPTYLTRERKNSQTRHILCCDECGDTLVEHYGNGGIYIGCFHHPEVKGRS